MEQQTYNYKGELPSLGGATSAAGAVGASSGIAQ